MAWYNKRCNEVVLSDVRTILCFEWIREVYSYFFQSLNHYMKDIIYISTIIISAIIVALILLQGRGAGLGSAWGGGGEMFQTRRGIEKITMRLTVAMIAVFLIVSVVNFFVKFCIFHPHSVYPVPFFTYAVI